MTARGLWFTALLGTGLLGRPARAQSSPDSQAHQHHGIFLRFLVGPAGFTGAATPGPNAFAYQGCGGGAAFAIGSSVSRSLVFYGEIFYDFAAGPTTTTRGTGEPGVASRFDGLGPGMTYYFPSNLYLGASLIIAELGVGQHDQYIGGGQGWGASATVGKEWWVSDRWAVGLAAQAFFGGRSSTVPGAPYPTSWAAGGAMIAFSATYN